MVFAHPERREIPKPALGQRHLRAQGPTHARTDHEVLDVDTPNTCLRHRFTGPLTFTYKDKEWVTELALRHAMQVALIKRTYRRRKNSPAPT